MGTFYWQADDGGVQAVSVNDRVKKVLCEKRAGSTQCLPKHYAGSFVLSDRYGVSPSCDVKLGSYWDPGNCTEHPYIVCEDVEPVDRCTSKASFHYFSVGQEVQEENAGTGDTCDAIVGRTPGYRYFQVGADVALSEFASAITVSHNEEETRLLWSFEMSESGKELLINSTLFDTELNVPCSPGFMGDTLRCVPETVQDYRNAIAPMFSDSSCTKEIVARVVADFSSELCGESPRYFVQASEPRACYFSTTKMSPGICQFTAITNAELIDAPTYSNFQLVAEACQEVESTRDEDDVGFAVYTLGASVPLDTFFTFVETIE